MTVVVTMISPFKNQGYALSSGNSYVSDQYGLIVNVQGVSDVLELQSFGCQVLNPPVNELLGRLNGADFNSTADQSIPIVVTCPYRIRRIVVTNTTVNGMSAAAGGIYQAAAKAGSPIVAAGQVYTGLTNALTALELTLALAGTVVLAAGTPTIFSLTTPHGSAAKADIFVYGDAYPTS